MNIVFFMLFIMGCQIFYSCKPSEQGSMKKLKRSSTLKRKVSQFDEEGCVEKGGTWNQTTQRCKFFALASECKSGENNPSESGENNPNCLVAVEFSGVVEGKVTADECSGDNLTYIQSTCYVNDVDKVGEADASMGLSENDGQAIPFAITLEECKTLQAEWSETEEKCYVDQSLLTINDKGYDFSSCSDLKGSWSNGSCYTLGDFSITDANSLAMDANTSDYTDEEKCTSVYGGTWVDENDTNSNADPNTCDCPDTMYWNDNKRICVPGSLYFKSDDVVMIQVRKSSSDEWRTLYTEERIDHWFITINYWPIISKSGDLDDTSNTEQTQADLDQKEVSFQKFTLELDSGNLAFTKTDADIGLVTSFKIKNPQTLIDKGLKNTTYWTALSKNDTFNGIVHGSCWGAGSALAWITAAVTAGASVAVQTTICTGISAGFEDEFPFGEIVAQHEHNDELGDDGTSWFLQPTEENTNKKELILDLGEEYDSHIYSEPFYLHSMSNLYWWGDDRETIAYILGGDDFSTANDRGYGPGFWIREEDESNVGQASLTKPQFRFRRCDELCQAILNTNEGD